MLPEALALVIFGDSVVTISGGVGLFDDAVFGVYVAPFSSETPNE